MVTCLVCRIVVPREEAVCVDDYQRLPARRRHVCGRCIRTMSLALHEGTRALAIASWRATIAAGAPDAAKGAERADRRS